MTHRRTLFTGIVVLGIAVAILHALAVSFFLYWSYPWFDTGMHFLGGAFVAFFALWLAHGAADRGWVLAKYPQYRPSAMLLFSVFAVLAVGGGWEIFEVLADVPREANYQFDTSLDLLMDTLGAIAAVAFIHWQR